jgi:hypothetical protein
LRRLTRIRSLANGFSMKSHAPFLVASTAVLIVPGDDDYRQLIVEVSQALEDVDAVHAGHLHVEQHEIRRLTLGECETLLAGRCAKKLVPFVFERHPQGIANRALVVDD